MLECLERATQTHDAAERTRLLTFCIVGGGPTGVEYAGALAELVRLVMPHEYPELPPPRLRIVLLEGGDRLLPTFAKRSRRTRARELERPWRRSAHRTRSSRRSTTTASNCATAPSIATTTMVWTAGVRPNDPLHARPKRLDVDDHLRIVGESDAFAIGDVAAARDKHGEPLPMLSPVAMQAGRYVARQILHGDARRPFRYHDKGTLATIGRTSAVGQIGPVRFRGLPRLARVARGAPLLPDRLREPPPGDDALGLVLRAPRPARTDHPASRPAQAGMTPPSRPL